MNATYWWLNLVNDATIADSSAAKATINAIVPSLALITGVVVVTNSVMESGDNTESPGTSYVRVDAAALTAGFSTASVGGVLTSDGDISYPAVTGSADWGTIKSVAIVDDLTENIIFFDILSPTVSPALGSVLKYSAGNLSFTGT